MCAEEGTQQPVNTVPIPGSECRINETECREYKPYESYEYSAYHFAAHGNVSLYVNDDKTYKHADDYGEGGQLALVHEDSLRDYFAEYNVEHGAAGEAEAEGET